MNRFNSKANWAGGAFSLAVVLYVLITLDWQQVMETFRQMDLVYVGLGFVVYLLNYVLRTLRFQTLLDVTTVPFRRLLGITQLYGMYLYLMPAKSGEISYPLLLKSREGVSLGSSAATLIAARLFDFAAIALLLPLALLVYWAQTPSWLRMSSLAFSGVVLGASGMAVAFLGSWQGRRTRAAGRSRFVEKMWRVVDQLRDIYARRQYARLGLLTLGIWLCVQINFYLITLGLGVQLTFFQIVVISLVMVPLTLLPLQGFANLGTHEIGWVTAFRIFAIPQDVALRMAVSTHFILLLFILLLGGMGMVLSMRQDDVRREGV